MDTSADDSSTEDNDTRTANEVVIGICIFLNFFQLFFRTSEKAILALLAFIRILFTFLGRINPGQQLNTEVALLLPRSIQTIRKLLRQENTGIREYVVCPRCNALYSMKDCIVHQNGRNESQVCGYVMYPNHPHLSKRNKCNTVLLKKIRVGCKNKLVPRKTFVYNSVIDGLKSLVCRRGFLQKCEHWLTCRCNTT